MGLQDELRRLPAVDRVVASLGVPASLGTPAARRAIDLAREEVRKGEPVPTLEEIVASARRVLLDLTSSSLRPVINATGVLIHTNLGRVPLGSRQLEAVERVSRGYSNLEYDLAAGERGSRYDHARRALVTLTGAGDALVVNNNAAAVVLMLAGLCAGREVIISRGELVEIGGEFRIPDVMQSAGVDLVEVGTTNRTHLSDYERAISPRTAAILKVHPSNYRVVGFTRSIGGRDVARLARGRGVCFLNDLGSGLVTPTDEGAFRAEPTVRESLEEGADLVTFSGDKLLGGPQAGIIAGRRDLIAQLSKHPLLRALRVDKMTLAALEATLQAHLEERVEDLPFWKFVSTSAASIEGRVRRIIASLEERLAGSGAKVEARPTSAVTGGGSLPGSEMASWSIAVADPERSAAELARRLRFLATPIVARVEDDVMLLDLRSVDPSEDDELADALFEVLG